MSHLTLKGGDAEKDLQFKKSEITHLRLLLAWMRCEYMLDENSQAGYAQGAKELVDHGYISEEKAKTMLTQKADEIKKVPKYIRQSVKMLTKMLAEHDKKGDIVDG
jgi:hypothetical protein